MTTAERIGRIVDGLEEGFIALLFAAMTLVTFTQVLLRYGFNTGFVWALELTTYLFAWLVLFGMSYGIRKSVHLGVDAFVKLFGEGPRRVFGLLAVTAGLVYAGILFVGSWHYVIDFLFAIGIPSEDLPVPQWLPMAILPIGLALLFLRLAQVGWRILLGRQSGMLLGDEASEAIRHFDELSGKDTAAGARADAAVIEKTKR